MSSTGKDGPCWKPDLTVRDARGRNGMCETSWRASGAHGWAEMLPCTPKPGGLYKHHRIIKQPYSLEEKVVGSGLPRRCPGREQKYTTLQGSSRGLQHLSEGTLNFPV